jgi:hypothetical protein
MNAVTFNVCINMFRGSEVARSGLALALHCTSNSFYSLSIRIREFESFQAADVYSLLNF